MFNIFNDIIIEIEEVYMDKNIFSLTLLNSTGDITLTWTDYEDEAIKKMIQDKINAGYCFFVMEPKVSFLKFLGDKKTTIKDVSDIQGKKITMKTTSNIDHKAVLETFKFGDSNAEELFKKGHIGVINVPESNYNTVRKTKNVNEIMKNHTIATPRIVAG
jgi:hypothetical protein